MLTRLKTWDSLGLRLFLLMWAALALSHLAAWSLVSQTLQGPGFGGHGGPPPR